MPFLPNFFTVNLIPLSGFGAIQRCATRAYANGSIIRLRQLVPEGLNSVKTDMIKKFLEHAGITNVHTGRDYKERLLKKQSNITSDISV